MKQLTDYTLGGGYTNSENGEKHTVSEEETQETGDTEEDNEDSSEEEQQEEEEESESDSFIFGSNKNLLNFTNGTRHERQRDSKLVGDYLQEMFSKEKNKDEKQKTARNRRNVQQKEVLFTKVAAKGKERVPFEKKAKEAELEREEDHDAMRRRGQSKKDGMFMVETVKHPQYEAVGKEKREVGPRVDKPEQTTRKRWQGEEVYTPMMVSTAASTEKKKANLRSRDSERAEDSEDVEMVEWLEELSLPLEYLKYLKEDGFDDLTTVRMITEKELLSVGIIKTGHRKKIMNWVLNNPLSLSPELGEHELQERRQSRSFGDELPRLSLHEEVPRWSVAYNGNDNWMHLDNNNNIPALLGAPTTKVAKKQSSVARTKLRRNSIATPLHPSVINNQFKLMMANSESTNNNAMASTSEEGFKVTPHRTMMMMI